jgi:hypothetical protein
MNTHVSIHAHPRYLVFTDAAALLMVLVLLFAASRIRFILSPLAFLLLGSGVLAGFAADVGWWFWKGIRALEISDDALTAHRGPALLPRELKRSAVLRVDFSRIRGSRKAVVRTRSGQRLRITEHAFSRQEFTRFLAALESWAPR